MAISLVQNASPTAGGTPPEYTYAFPSNVTAGNLLTFCCRIGSSTIVVESITDSVGSTWTQVVNNVNGSSAQGDMWYAFAGGSGANTITVTLSTSITLQVGIHEWTGNASSSVIDKTNSADCTSTTTHTMGGITGPASNSLVICFSGLAGSFTESTEPSGYTDLNPQGSRSRAWYKIKTDSSDESPSWDTVSDATSAGIMATFKEASGSSPQTAKPSAAAATATSGGQSITGALTVTATEAVAAATSGGQSITGSLTVALTQAVATATANDPTVVAGSVPQTATPTSAVGSAVAGGHSTAGALTVAATEAVAAATAGGHTTSNGITTSPGSAAATSAAGGQSITGSLAVSPTPAAAAAEIGPFTVDSGAPPAQTSTPSSAIASAVSGGHTITGSYTIVPISAVALAVVTDPGLVYDQIATPASAVATAAIGPFTASAGQVLVTYIDLEVEYPQTIFFETEFNHPLYLEVLTD